MRVVAVALGEEASIGRCGACAWRMEGGFLRPFVNMDESPSGLRGWGSGVGIAHRLDIQKLKKLPCIGDRWVTDVPKSGVWDLNPCEW